MTIVLQNKFWNLNVRDDGFAVGLSFNQVPAELDIPYAAITQFVDPAVDFGLQFQATVADMAPAETEHPENDGAELVMAPVEASEDVCECRHGRFRPQEVGVPANPARRGQIMASCVTAYGAKAIKQGARQDTPARPNRCPVRPTIPRPI